MNVLVTGGAGFIGSHVCDFLIQRGDHVICIDKQEKNIAHLRTNPLFRMYTGDIRDTRFLKQVFEQEQIDKIIHLAALTGVRSSINNPVEYEEVNVKGTLHLLELARTHAIKTFIFGSSSSVYGSRTTTPFNESDPTDAQVSPYAATKKAGELLCYLYHTLYPINITCLRFFTVYGPRGREDMAVYTFTKNILEGKELTVYGEGSARDYTYVLDIVQGVAAALDKDLPYEIINLGNSTLIPLTQLISTIETCTGKKASIRKLPNQTGDVPVTCADITKAKQLLNYEPHTKLRQGIQSFVTWYLEAKR